MKRLLSGVHLNLIAGAIALGILAVSADVLWTDRIDTWHEAQKSTRNVLTALARDLTSDLELLDLSLKGSLEGLRTVGFRELPPELQHRVLFDRSVSAPFMGSLLIADENGNLIADAGPIIAPRTLNVSNRDYFTAHKENTYIGLYVSRPFPSRLRDGELSIGMSRRLPERDGRFSGIVMGAIPFVSLNEMFEDLRLGQNGSINLFRSDGILLTRYPFNEKLVGLDLSTSPEVQRLLQKKADSFESISPIDGVRRFISYEHLDRFPLVLTVARSVDEVFAAWTRRAIILGLVTGALCLGVVGLTMLFQRELNRRKEAEIKLRRLARTDDLTGLPNRRGFRETFAREWRQAARAGTSLSLLYIDVDFFKNYNDRCGHGRGDEVLSAIARTLNASIRRPRDIAARYGGEEFAVLLPETGLSGARTIAETIRQAVIDMHILHPGAPCEVATVSIGAATAKPSHDSSSQDLLEAADAALYRAKAAGRNCTFVSEEHGTQSHERSPHVTVGQS